MMIIIPWFAITAVMYSIVGWFAISAIIALMMFGDDRAFKIGPIIATIAVIGFWLLYSGVVRFG